MAQFTDTALFAVTFINIWSGYPFYMTSLLAGLQGIPTELYEAAEVDGADGWQRFMRITLPQLKPIIISMALLDVIWTTQQFALIWMTTGGGPLGTTEMLSTFTYKLAFSKYQFWDGLRGCRDRPSHLDGARVLLRAGTESEGLSMTRIQRRLIAKAALLVALDESAPSLRGCRCSGCCRVRSSPTPTSSSTRRG